MRELGFKGFLKCIINIKLIFKIKSGKDIENALKVKNLVNIPIDYKNNENVNKDAQKRTFDAFKVLRTNLQFSSMFLKSNSKTLLVTSSNLMKGKSNVSANIAIAFAQLGKRVILVDSDMHNSKSLNINNDLGLTNYIIGFDSNGYEIERPYSYIIRKTKVKNLFLITTGTIPPNPAELFASEKMDDLLNRLRRDFDLIIFDGAPALLAKDSVVLARKLNNTLLIAEYNNTRKIDLLKTKVLIESTGSHVIGTVLNRIPTDLSEVNDEFYYSNKVKAYKDKSFKVRFTNWINNFNKNRNKKHNERLIKIKQKEEQLKLKREEEQKRIEEEKRIKEERERELRRQKELEEYLKKKKEFKEEKDNLKNQIEDFKKRKSEFEKAHKEQIKNEESVDNKNNIKDLTNKQEEQVEQEEIVPEVNEEYKVSEKINAIEQTNSYNYNIEEKVEEPAKPEINYDQISENGFDYETGKYSYFDKELDSKIHAILEEKRMMEEAERKAQEHFDEVEKQKRLKKINVEFRPEFLPTIEPEIKMRKFDEIQQEAIAKGIKAPPVENDNKENSDELDEGVNSSKVKIALKKFGKLVKHNYQEYETKQRLREAEYLKKQEQKRKAQEQKRIEEEAERKAQEQFDLLEKQKKEEEQKRDLELVKKAQKELKQIIDKEKKSIEEEEEKKRKANLTPEEEYEEVSKDLYQMNVAAQIKDLLDDNNDE